MRLTDVEETYDEFHAIEHYFGKRSIAALRSGCSMDSNSCDISPLSGPYVIHQT